MVGWRRYVRIPFGSGIGALGIRKDRPGSSSTGIASDSSPKNAARRRVRGRRSWIPGVLVFDLIYVAAIIAVFVVVGLIAKGVERL